MATADCMSSEFKFPENHPVIPPRQLLSEKDFTEQEPVFWRNSDDTITEGKISRISLYPPNTYICVKWEDCAGDAVYRSSERNSGGSFDKVEKKNYVVSHNYGVLPVTDIEFEEIKA